MPKYLKTALAAYHGDVSDIKETLLSNASPYEGCPVKVAKGHLKHAQNNNLVYRTDTLGLFPLHAAIFSRKKDNLEFLLANNTEINYLWKDVYLETLSGSKPDNAFTLANKLGLDEFTFILLIHAIKFLNPFTLFDFHYNDVGEMIIKGIKRGIFSNQQIKEIAELLEGIQGSKIFVNLVGTNMLEPIQIFLNNGASVNSINANGVCALQVALTQPNIDIEIIKLFFSLGVNTKYINPREPTPLIEFCRSPVMRQLFIELEQANDLRNAELAKQEELRLLQTKDVIQKQVTESAKLPNAEPATTKIPIAESVPTTAIDCGCCSFGFLWTKRKVATPPDDQVRSNQDVKHVLSIS